MKKLPVISNSYFAQPLAAFHDIFKLTNCHSGEHPTTEMFTEYYEQVKEVQGLLKNIKSKNEIDVIIQQVSETFKFSEKIGKDYNFFFFFSLS